MRKWKEIASGLFWIAVGSGILWATWSGWQDFAQLESGELKSMKIWAPLAWIYNLGGTWAFIAKWAFLAMVGLTGLALTLAGVMSFFPAKEHESPDQQAVSQNDARYDLEVTAAQIANEDEIVIRGPNGTLAIKLQKTMLEDHYLRYPGEGFEGKGDLYVLIKVHNA